MFYDLYCSLCQAKGEKPSRSAENMGINRSTVSQWKSKYEQGIDITPNIEVLKKISDYFSVPTDRLLGKEDQKEKPTVNDGGRLSVEERVEQILDGMANEHSGTLMLDGKPASPEALDALRQAIKMGVEYARKINSEKK